MECWNLKIWFKSKKKILSENPFQTWTVRSGVMCTYSTLSHDKLDYTHMAPLFINVWSWYTDLINNFKTWFDISNKFSRDRSFGHKALETIRYNMIAALDQWLCLQINLRQQIMYYFISYYTIPNHLYRLTIINVAQNTIWKLGHFILTGFLLLQEKMV